MPPKYRFSSIFNHHFFWKEKNDPNCMGWFCSIIQFLNDRYTVQISGCCFQCFCSVDFSFLRYADRRFYVLVHFGIERRSLI